MITLPWSKPQPKQGKPQWDLDMPLLSLGKGKPWTLRDAYGDVLILGLKGSGKTSGPGQTLALNYLKAGFGGLVVCAQIEEADLWRSYLRKAGREKDGRFFSLSGEFRCNFLQFEASQEGGGSVENLAHLLLNVSPTRKSSKGGTSENAEYWARQKTKLIRNCLTLLKIADEPIQLRNLYKLMISAPQNPTQVVDANWKKESYLAQLLSRCGKSDHVELPLLSHFWLSHWPNLRERPSVESDFTGMLDATAIGELADFFDTITNLTPDDILKGRIIVIDIPILRHDEIGKIAALIWIQLFQRALNRRIYTAPNSRPVFLWEDEAQYFTLPQDARFQSTSRHKGVSVVRLTQTIPGFREEYGSPDSVDGLLGGHVTKLFCRNDCPVTTKWCSELIGRVAAYKESVNTSGASGSGAVNTSISTAEEYSCPPREFFTLKNGGPDNRGIVEAIICQSGRLFGDSRWAIAEFRQK